MHQNPERPDKDAVIAAYQVTIQLRAAETSLIWSRASLFLVFNTILIGGLLTIESVLNKPGDAHLLGLLQLLVSLGALAYLTAWTISMGRAWNYHDFFIHMMKEQESFLKLQELAPMSRGDILAKGGSDTVAGKDFRFNRLAAVLNARTLEKFTAFAFALLYLLLVSRGISHILS